MKYWSYLLNEQGEKINRAQRHGHQGRAHMNEVYEHNKKLHGSRYKKMVKYGNA